LGQVKESFRTNPRFSIVILKERQGQIGPAFFVFAGFNP